MAATEDEEPASVGAGSSRHGRQTHAHSALGRDALGRAAFASLSQGIVVHARDGRIIECNQAAERILGLTLDQMSGRTPIDAGWHAVHDDATPFPSVTHPAAMALATGEPVRDVTMGVHKPDGTLTWIWVSAELVADLGDGDEAVVVATFTDITVQVRLGDEVTEAAGRLRESEEKYRLLAENSSDVVARLRGSTLIWVSPSVTAVSGWSPEELVGADADEFVHPDDIDSVRRTLRDLAPGEKGHSRRRLRDSAGDYHWVESHFQLYLGVDGTADGVIASLRLVDAEVAASLALEHRARHDDLTGLLTRAEVVDRLERLLADPRRSRSNVAVAFCDIDDFKDINGRHGHGGGDEALRVLAARITSIVREDDLVARMGGDEILVVLSGVRDLHEAAQIADKLREQAIIPVTVPGGSVAVTLSVGVTLADASDDIDALIARADDAMYSAKANGKDRVVALAGPDATRLRPAALGGDAVSAP